MSWKTCSIKHRSLEKVIDNTQKKASLFSSSPLSSHFLFAQLFIKINFPTGYSSACSLSFSLSLFFSQLFLSFITLSVRHTSDRALSIVIGYFSTTYPCTLFFSPVVLDKNTHTRLYSLFSCFIVN